MLEINRTAPRPCYQIMVKIEVGTCPLEINRMTTVMFPDVI